MRSRKERELEKELRFHIEERTRELIGSGKPAADARRQARLEFGPMDTVSEECRDVRRTRWLDDFVQDLRYALRTLRQNPGFAAVALLTLALGSGGTTVMFTLMNGVLLTPLRYGDPQRLLILQQKTANGLSNDFNNL